MTKNKRRLMRGDEEQQRPYKRATRPRALSELSEQVVSRLRRSVVFLASFDGDTKLRECTGICIETSCSDSEATILTSRRLVPPTWPASLTIKVRLPNDQIVTGWIEDPGIYVDFFIVNIKEVSRVDATSLDRDIQFEPHTKAAAVCRCFSSGFLTVTSGLNLASPTSETIVSTCWIHKAGIGGPLVDFDGNFVGMNSSRTKMEKTAYVRRKQILRFLVFHGMVSVKEGVDDATQARINSEMKAIRPSLDATSIARLSESRKGALSEQVLARLSKSVAALASFHGDTKLRECTGICIESSCPGVTSFLTSINLIPLTWRASKITKNLKIKVRLLNDETVTGWIADPEIYVDFFIVNVAGVNATHVSLDRDMQFEPYRKVAAVCRNFNSGLLMDTSGVDLASPSALPDQTMFSTCQIDKVGIGGPLVDFDGNFVGMNCSCTKERKTPYVRRAAILRFLGVNGMVSVKDVVDDATRAFLKTMAEHHVTIFKEIEVCLPNKFRVVGILKGYNLHYNVALVDIIGCWDPHAIQISGRPVTSSMDVIAVGCLFAYRKLMAVEGKVLIGKQSKFDCTELCVSTCKITKAGIGGPLIDTDGNFVGMNFYDEEETPFLPRDLICRLLLNVNKEWASADDTIMECDKNRWLLPGGTHRNTDGNRWPLPKPRLVGVRDVCL
ncbi:uncharacterized protein [Aegilops tauschii subsp. strangulata]|nr:uncharacterized protein LOC109760204 [Aegilops tauschii subsp. strangulata]